MSEINVKTAWVIPLQVDESLIGEHGTILGAEGIAVAVALVWQCRYKNDPRTIEELTGLESEDVAGALELLEVLGYFHVYERSDGGKVRIVVAPGTSRERAIKDYEDAQWRQERGWSTRSFKPTSMMRRIAERDGGWLCHYCHKPLASSQDSIGNGVYPPQIEHKKPRAHGGPTTLTNLVLSCMDCNSWKGARHGYEEFYAMTAPLRAARSESQE